jgi:hypothetical protein
MDKLKVDSEGAYTWIEEYVATTWINALLSEFPKCDMLLNNHSDAFNRYSDIILKNNFAVLVQCLILF